MVDRRTLSTMLMAGVASSVFGWPSKAQAQPAATARNVVLVPTPPASAGLVKSGGFAQLSEDAFLRDFAGDIEPTKARILYAVQGRISDTLFSGKTTNAAWRSKPSWYAISTEDRTISPELERFMADRMKAKTIEVKASHLSLISHPQEIANLILNAAGHSS
jgi:pimeloyl-ACP methyl ester carboxylesterase